MNKLPRITEIIKIEPFKITCKWSTGEILVSNFEPFFDKWQKENNLILLPLLNYENFKYVSISESNTLQWVNIPVVLKNFDNTEKIFPLDICPDVIYSESKPIKNYKLVAIEEFEDEEILSF